MKHFSCQHHTGTILKYFKIRTSKHLTCNISIAFDRLRIVSIESCEVLGFQQKDLILWLFVKNTAWLEQLQVSNLNSNPKQRRSMEISNGWTMRRQVQIAEETNHEQWKNLIIEMIF